MANHTDGFATGVQGIQRIKGGIQRFAIQRAKTFIKEQRVNTCFMADQIRKRQRQRQTNEETFAAGKGTGIAYRICLRYLQPRLPAPRWLCAVTDSARAAG